MKKSKNWPLNEEPLYSSGGPTLPLPISDYPSYVANQSRSDSRGELEPWLNAHEGEGKYIDWRKLLYRWSPAAPVNVWYDHVPKSGEQFVVRRGQGFSSSVESTIAALDSFARYSVKNIYVGDSYLLVFRLY